MLNLYRALLDDNPFLIIDGNQTISKSNLMGRIKRFQSIMLTSNSNTIAIINTELTANTIAVYLAAVLLNKEIVFLSAENPIEEIIAECISSRYFLWFSDYKTINKIKNKLSAKAFINVVNINNFAVKIKAEFVPLTDTSNVLDSIQCLNTMEECPNYDVPFGIHKGEVINVYDPDPSILFVILQAITNGAILQLRKQALKNQTVVISFKSLLPVLKGYNINLMPIYERNIISDIIHHIKQKLSFLELKTALNKRIFVLNKPRFIYLPYSFNAVESPTAATTKEAIIELIAFFNLPIKSSKFHDNCLYIYPDYSLIDMSEYEFRHQLDEFKLRVNNRYQAEIKNVVILPTP